MEIVDALIVAEPKDFVLGEKHAARFYEDIIRAVEKLGMIARLVYYKGSAQKFEYPSAPILICHGLAASSLIRELKPRYSILVGCSKKLGFNVSLINDMDNIARASHLQFTTPNAHHYVLTPGMASSLSTHLQRAKQLITTPAIPASQAKTASQEFMHYKDHPDYLDKRALEDIVRDAVGEKYPTPTVNTQLWKALHAHGTHIGEGQIPKEKVLADIGDLVRAKRSLELGHSSNPMLPGAVGKVNHALDLFARQYNLAEAEHHSILRMSAERNQQHKVASNAEEDLKLWHAWNKSKDPDDLSSLLTHLAPLIHNESNKWQQTGINKDILSNQARSYAFEAIKSYDPKHGQLNTHVINNLKKLNRFSIENQNAIRVQENKIFDYRNFMREKQDLENLLGREATKEELQSHLGIGGSVGSYKPMMENYYGAHSEAGGSVIRQELNHDSTALNLAFDAMNPRQKIIFAHSYGYNKAPLLANNQIAKKVGVSAAMISKQKRAIDKLVNEHVEASRFLLSST